MIQPINRSKQRIRAGAIAERVARVFAAVLWVCLLVGLAALYFWMDVRDATIYFALCLAMMVSPFVLAGIVEGALASILSAGSDLSEESDSKPNRRS